MKIAGMTFLARVRVLCVFPVLLVLLLIAYLVLQIALNPDVGLLPMSFSSGQWILAPVSIATTHGRGKEANFTKEIDLPVGAEGLVSAVIRVTAGRSYEVRLNRHLISGANGPGSAHNWRVPQEFDLKDALNNGRNLLEIWVRNTARPPALLVSGTITLRSGEEVSIDSDATWRVWCTSEIELSAPPEGMPPPRDFFPDHYSARMKNARTIRMFETFARLVAYLLIAFATAVYLHRIRSHPGVRRAEASHDKPFLPPPVAPFFPRTNIQRWICASLLVALYFPMAVIRDPTEGWDAEGHIEHIRYVARERKVPMPDQGWEMFQPPAYYQLAASVYAAALPWSRRAAERWNLASADFLALKAVQLLTPLFAIIQILIVLKFVHYLFPQRQRTLLLTTAFVALLPMQIYLSSFISNEMFASMAISAALFLLVVLVREKRFEIGPSAALGSAIGFACLSKYSGFLLAMTACLVYAVLLVMRLERPRRLLISFMTVALLFLAVAGPFYLRNIRKYGKPLPHNSEFVPEFTIEYFDMAFLLDPSRIGLGAVDKFVSRASSFVDGNYSSMWIDNSHKSHPWTRVFEIAIYYLAIFPTFLIGVGFFRAVRGCRRDSKDGTAYLTIVTIFIFAVFSYVYFILRFGSFEVVKAFYLLSQVSPLAVFFELGSSVQANGKPKALVFEVAIIIVYVAITVYYLLVPFLIGKGL